MHVPSGSVPAKVRVQAEGKTKRIWATEDRFLVVMENKDDTTAGDGARRESIDGKAEASTDITAAVFAALEASGVPTHFRAKSGPREIVVEACDMVPLEVVYRYVSTGSYLKRRQHALGSAAEKDGTILPAPVYELLYKQDVFLADGAKYSDPLMLLGADGMPILEKGAFLGAPDFTAPVLLSPKTGARLGYVSVAMPSGKRLSDEQFATEVAAVSAYAAQVAEITPRAFDALRALYRSRGVETLDGKIEFGVNRRGQLKVADVIDGDSCRLRQARVVEAAGAAYLTMPFSREEFDDLEISGSKDRHSAEYWSKLPVLPAGAPWDRILAAKGLDKQGFREGESADVTIRKYRALAALLLG